jgi:prepilin peptidase CpaA
MLSVVWGIFAAIMVVAAVIDLISYRIPNALVVALLALFVLAAALNWSSVAWLNHLAAAVVVLGAGIFFYAFKQMGAGDVKFLAVVALWAGGPGPVFESGLLPLLFWVAICGLLGMLVIVVLRQLAPHFQPSTIEGKWPLPRVLRKGQGIPYAIAIGPGAIIASFSFSPWLWRL